MEAEIFLINVRESFSEMNNVVREHPDIVNALQKECQDFMATLDAQSFRIAGIQGAEKKRMHLHNSMKRYYLIYGTPIPKTACSDYRWYTSVPWPGRKVVPAGS